MSVKELNATLRDFERGARAMEKAHKMERILNERKERTFQITLAAEEMQKRGASQSSVRRFVEIRLYCLRSTFALGGGR